MLLENESGRNVSIYWFNYIGDMRWYESMADGDSRLLSSFVEHAWVTTDGDGLVVPMNGQCLHTKSAEFEIVTLSFG